MAPLLNHLLVVAPFTSSLWIYSNSNELTLLQTIAKYNRNLPVSATHLKLKRSHKYTQILYFLYASLRTQSNYEQKTLPDLSILVG